MEFRQARPQKPDQRRQTKIWLVRFALIAGFIFLVKLFTFISGRPNPVDNAITAVGTPVVNVVKRIGEGIGGRLRLVGMETLYDITTIDGGGGIRHEGACRQAGARPRRKQGARARGRA